MKTQDRIKYNCWETLVSCMSDAAIFTDSDLKITFVNLQAEKLLNIKQSAVKGNDIIHHFPSLSVLVQKRCREDGEKTFGFHEKSTNLKGTVFTVEDQQAPGTFMIVFNAIEAVFFNPSICNKHKHNRGLIEQANEAFFIFDTEGRYIDISPMACQLTGYTEQELLRKNIVELVPSLCRKNINSFMTNLKEGDFIFVEGALLCKDGSAREVEISTQIISNGRFFSSCRDISNKKTGQRTLNKSGDKYLWLAEQSDDHVLVRDTNVPGRTDVSNTFQDINYTKMAETKAKLFDRFSSQQKKSDSYILTQNLIVSKLAKSELSDATSDCPQLFAECWTQLTQDGKMITFLRDITEKRQTELSLKKSEQQYRLLFQHNPLPLLVMDLETFGFLDVNEAAVQQYGYIRDEFLQLTALDLRPKKDVAAFLNTVKQTRGGLMNLGYFQHQRKDGTVIDVEIFQHDFLFQDRPSVLVIAKDVTKNLKAERELLETTSQLRALSAHLESIREEERASMAREVHDELGQQLFSLKMDISWLNKKLKLAGEPSLQQRSDDALKMVNTTIQTVRKIATELRLSVLDNLGLIAAMEWQNKEFTKRSGIHISFESGIFNDEIPSGEAICLFRIYQETLTNVGRHAKAKNIFTQIAQTNTHIILTVIDDGNGFNIAETGSKKTFGLLGMRERALMFGGVCDINSFPGKGTIITAKVPIKPKSKKNAHSDSR